ncbi:MAG: HNH endonuclease, partial [Planctomycetota bacterium]
MSPRSWTREQLLTTLALYCQTPFGRMHKGNPAIIALGAVIDRTPSAVALKLVNFASLDPELSRRGVGGMGNTSAADRGVWEEFYGRWEVLAEHATILEAPARGTPSDLADSATSPAGAGEERVTEVSREI